MLHTKAHTGPRARRKHAGSQLQRQAQTKALLRVLQKVQLLPHAAHCVQCKVPDIRQLQALKKARNFETRKTLRRLKVASEACIAGVWR